MTSSPPLAHLGPIMVGLLTIKLLSNHTFRPGKPCFFCHCGFCCNVWAEMFFNIFSLMQQMCVPRTKVGKIKVFADVLTESFLLLLQRVLKICGKLCEWRFRKFAEFHFFSKIEITVACSDRVCRTRYR